MHRCTRSRPHNWAPSGVDWCWRPLPDDAVANRLSRPPAEDDKCPKRQCLSRRKGHESCTSHRYPCDEGQHQQHLLLARPVVAGDNPVGLPPCHQGGQREADAPKCEVHDLLLSVDKQICGYHSNKSIICQ